MSLSLFLVSLITNLTLVFMESAFPRGKRRLFRLYFKCAIYCCEDSSPCMFSRSLISNLTIICRKIPPSRGKSRKIGQLSFFFNSTFKIPNYHSLCSGRLANICRKIVATPKKSLKIGQFLLFV